MKPLKIMKKLAALSMAAVMSGIGVWCGERNRSGKRLHIPGARAGNCFPRAQRAQASLPPADGAEKYTT